jgi:hypothetical protein
MIAMFDDCDFQESPTFIIERFDYRKAGPSPSAIIRAEPPLATGLRSRGGKGGWREKGGSAPARAAAWGYAAANCRST